MLKILNRGHTTNSELVMHEQPPTGSIGELHHINEQLINYTENLLPTCLVSLSIYLSLVQRWPAATAVVVHQLRRIYIQSQSIRCLIASLPPIVLSAFITWSNIIIVIVCLESSYAQTSTSKNYF